MLCTFLYNPLTPIANDVSSAFNNVITSANTTFNTICTVTISSVSAVVNGLMKTSNPPSPNTAIAAPIVANISTIIRLRRTPTARPAIWRFSTGSAPASVVAGGRALISLVVDVMAAVMRLICAPTSTVAAVFSMRLEEVERGARVASVVC